MNQTINVSRKLVRYQTLVKLSVVTWHIYAVNIDNGTWLHLQKFMCLCPVATIWNNAVTLVCMKLMLSYWFPMKWALSLCLTVKLSIHCWLSVELALSLTDSEINFVLLTYNTATFPQWFTLWLPVVGHTILYSAVDAQEMNLGKSSYPWLISLI